MAARSVSRDPGRVEVAIRREYGLLAPVYERVWARYLAASIVHTLDCLPLSAGDRILDVGCGTGLLLAGMRARQAELDLHGIELTPAMLRRADGRLGEAATLRIGSARDLPYPDAHFDIVTSTNMLHDIAHDHADVIGEWGRVLRPGGSIAVTDWDPGHRGTRIRARALSLIGRRPTLHTPEELSELLAEADVRVRGVRAYPAGTWGLWTVHGVRASSAAPDRPGETASA